MVLDEVLVLGLAVPLVMPLGCLAVASRLAAWLDAKGGNVG